MPGSGRGSVAADDAVSGHGRPRHERSRRAAPRREAPGRPCDPFRLRDDDGIVCRRAPGYPSRDIPGGPLGVLRLPPPRPRARPARPLDRPAPRRRRPPHAVRERGGRGRRGAGVPASQDRRRRRHDDHRPRLPGVPVHRRDRRPVRARRTAAPRPVPPRGLAPRRHPGPGPGRDGRPHGQRRARGGRRALPARVERAHDARGPARLGSAGRGLGTPSGSPGCAPRASHSSSSWPSPTGASTPRAGSSSDRTGGGSSASSAGPTSGSRRCTCWSGIGRRSSPGSSASTAASRWPTPRAGSGGRPYPGRSWARSSARTARPCSPGTLLGVLLRRHLREGGLRLAIRRAGARLRGRARGGGPSPAHSPRPAPGLPRQQDPRDRALGPPLLGPHRRGVGARLRGGGRPGASGAGPAPSRSRARTRSSPT